MIRVDQIQQWQAEQVIRVFEAEQAQVVVIGVNVHAFMHVGDRCRGAGKQQFAASFGFLERAIGFDQSVSSADVMKLTSDDVQ